MRNSDTLVFRPSQPCICGSGLPLQNCHLGIDGSFSKPVPSLIPLGPKTNYSHPGCYLSCTNDCSSKISGEHYVSEALLLQMGSALEVFGLPWLDKDKSLIARTSSLKANILCTRHNSALAPLDSEAALLFKELQKALNALEKKSISRKPSFSLISGETIERWLLKVSCGMYYSIGSSEGERVSRTHTMNMDKVQKALLDGVWDNHGGMYFNASVGKAYETKSEFKVAPLTSQVGNLFCGAQIFMHGFGLDFIFDSAHVSAPPWEGFVHRPQALLFIHKHRRHYIFFTWSLGHKGLTIHLKRGIGAN